MIDYKVAGAVARITLNRPEKRNALNDAMIANLTDALAEARSEVERVVLIAGAGHDFCSGLDLRQLQESAHAGVEEHLASAQAAGGCCFGRCGVIRSRWLRRCGDGRWAEAADWRTLAT